MFDRLDDLVIRYEELMGELQEPDVANDPERFRKLMKEQSDLAPIVEAYQEYKKCKQNIEDSLLLLEDESDERCGNWPRRNSAIPEKEWRSWNRS